jgi:heme/copper-type cytochrome/quinol oxidase subunit 2
MYICICICIYICIYICVCVCMRLCSKDNRKQSQTKQNHHNCGIDIKLVYEKMIATVVNTIILRMSTFL